MRGLAIHFTKGHGKQMKGYQQPGFQERVAAANRAKADALEKLRNKPPVDEAELALRAERERAREAAAAEKRAAARLAREEALAAKQEQALAKAEAARPKTTTPEEQKAARDARYAARKARKS